MSTIDIQLHNNYNKIIIVALFIVPRDSVTVVHCKIYSSASIDNLVDYNICCTIIPITIMMRT